MTKEEFTEWWIHTATAFLKVEAIARATFVPITALRPSYMEEKGIADEHYQRLQDAGITRAVEAIRELKPVKR